MLKSVPVILLLGLIGGQAFAAKPPLEIPTRGDAVLDRLPPGYARLAPGRSTPATLETVDAMLATARQSGDMRLASRAEAVLDTLPEAQRESAYGLRLKAIALQHRHEFAPALRALDRVLATAPGDASARLVRAQMHVVQGRIGLARKDCAALALRFDVPSGTLCTASLSLRMGDHATAAMLMDRWLEQPPADVELRRHLLVLRGEAASRAGDRNADRWFREALALRPSDVRTLSAFSRHLNSTGKHAEVLRLLDGTPSSDTLMLQKTIAATRARHPDGPRLASELADRFSTMRRAGLEPELRDEAELALLQGDARRALALASENFRTQRDYEDIDLLARAVQATGQRPALEPVVAWARSEHLQLPELEGRS